MGDVLNRFFARRTRRPVAPHDEAGLAMIIVMVVIMLMTLISLTMFSQAIEQLPLARHDQDHEASLAAA